MTKLSFPIRKLIERYACLDGLQRLSKSLVGPYDGTTVVNYYDNVEHCETSDLLWALNLTQLTDNEIRTISTKVSIYAARSVLHLFENEFPNDPRPRRAIEAAEACVATNFSDESVAAVARAEAATWSAVAKAVAKAAAEAATEAAAWSARAATWSARAATEAATEAAAWSVARTAERADPNVEADIKNYALELIRSYDYE